MISRQLFSFVITSLLFIFISPPCSPLEHDGTTFFPAIKQDEKVNLSLYYETLCPGCATFISYDLVKVCQMGLIDIINLKLVPWGNAELVNQTTVCQHGEDECYFNTIHACAIDAWPELKKHFKFIHCMESQTLKGRISDKEKVWQTCCRSQKLNPKIIYDCYNTGHGKELELKYGNETESLNPQLEFVPWVTVNGIAIREDYENVVKYVCTAYKGQNVPEACKSLSAPARPTLPR